MALPKLNHPTFDVKIPSTNKVYTFRPYTVKEQKILLMLQGSTDPEELYKTVKELIGATCVGAINIDKLAYFDIEYLLLRLRAKSVGEISKLSYKCNNIVEGAPCSTNVDIDINLEEIQVDFGDDKSPDILIQDGVIMKLGYPSIKSAKLIEEYDRNKNIESLVAAICQDVVSIVDKEQVYSDYTKEELAEFINSLSITVFDQILAFYVNVPKLRKQVTFKCKKCGYTEEIKLEGIGDFFA